MTTPESRRALPWWSLLALATGVTALHAPALFGGTYFLDVYLTEVHPHFAAIRRSLLAGHLPWWTGDIMLGYPLASNPQVGVFYLPHLLGLWLVDAHVVLTFSAWLHCLVAALSTWGLARRIGCGPAGAVLAGLVYACAPFVVFYHMAIHGLVALALMPAVLLSTWQAAETGRVRWWAVGALLLAAQMYAGHLQFVLYTLMATPIVAAFGPAVAPRRRWRVAAWCVLQGIVAVLLYAPQLLLAYELWQQSLRKAMSAADIVAAMGVEALGADDLVELLLPRFFGGPSFRDFWYPEFLGIGVVAAALSTIGLRDRRTRVWWGLLLGASVYLALVQLPVVGEVLVSIPPLSAFRAPGRLFCWILLAASLLAGRGIGHLSGSRIALGALVCGALLGGLTGAGVFDGVTPRDPELDVALAAGMRRSDGWALFAVAAGLLGVPLIARWSAGRVPERTLTATATVIVLLSVGWVAHRYNPTLFETDDPPAASAIPPGSRVLGISAGDPAYMASVPGPMGWPFGEADPQQAGHSLVANVGMAWSLQNLHGQTSLPLGRFIERVFGPTAALSYPFQRHPPIALSLLEHLGVEFVVAPKDGQMPVQPRPPFYRETARHLIHRVAARPRARWVPMTAVLGALDRATAMSEVQRSGEVLNRPLVIEGLANLPMADAPADVPATVAREGGRTLRVTVTAPDSGILFLAESWYPRWRATVDGEEAAVLIADGAFIGVPVSAGTHHVMLSLDLTPVWWGLGLAGLGGILVLLGFARGGADEHHQISHQVGG